MFIQRYYSNGRVYRVGQETATYVDFEGKV